MVAENPMRDNFAGILGGGVEKQFDRERSFGKKLLITAWAVEILAALLGLFIAFAMAFDDPEPHQALKVILKFP